MPRQMLDNTSASMSNKHVRRCQKVCFAYQCTQCTLTYLNLNICHPIGSSSEWIVCQQKYSDYMPNHSKDHLSDQEAVSKCPNTFKKTFQLLFSYTYLKWNKQSACQMASGWGGVNAENDPQLADSLATIMQWVSAWAWLDPDQKTESDESELVS